MQTNANMLTGDNGANKYTFISGDKRNMNGTYCNIQKPNASVEQ